MAGGKPGSAIVARLEKTYRGFNAGAVRKLYPALKGEEYVRAVARESMRSTAYLENMRTRIAKGAKLHERDPSLSDIERRERLQALERQERHYLKSHIAAQAWRLTSEADISRLKEQGEPGGFWVLNENAKTHTPDCLAMAGKYWGWDVLDRVNPANRHTGCGCKVISREAAERKGYRIRKGRKRKIKVVEAHLSGEVIKVPVRAGARGGNPYHGKGGRFTFSPFVRVPGVPGHGVSSEIRAQLDTYLDTVKDGDVGKMDDAFDQAVKATRSIEDSGERAANLRMLSRVRAAAINPEGIRARSGTRVNLAGAPGRPVPQPVSETRGNTRPWGEKGNFAWFIHGDSLGDQRDRLLNSLRDTGDFNVTENEDGATLETKPELDPVYALAAARFIEIQAPQLRNSRLAGADDALGTNTPLDMHPDEILSDAGRAPESRYPLITWDQVGKAAEALAPEARDRLVSLGMIRKEDKAELPGMRQTGTGVDEDPLDWEIGHYGIEVKSESMRGLPAFMARKGSTRIDAKQQARKVAAADARDLKPALVHAVTDFDNDVGHLFFHEYRPGTQPFAALRLPQALRQGLIDGTLKPGDAATPSMGKNAGDPEHQTVYLGTFRLPFNPLRPSSIGPKRTIKPGRKLSQPDMATLARREKPTKAADVGVGKRDSPELVTPVGTAKQADDEASTFRKSELEDRNEVIAKLWLEKEHGGEELGQSAIARRVGLSQPGVRRVLIAKYGEDRVKSRGSAGARHDLGSRRQKPVPTEDRRKRIVDLFTDELLMPGEIATRIKSTRGYVRKVLREEGVLADALRAMLDSTKGMKDPPTEKEIANEFGLSIEDMHALLAVRVAESDAVAPSLEPMEPKIIEMEPA